MGKVENRSTKRDILREVDSHFSFGENWASYSQGIDEDKILSAVGALQRLIKPQQLNGARFIDIGSGSGLHSLAALRSGVANLLTPDSLGAYDIVYSWGVLHHTGAMYEAMRRAAALVAPGALCVCALSQDLDL